MFLYGFTDTVTDTSHYNSVCNVLAVQVLSATIPLGSGSKLKIHDIPGPMKLVHFGYRIFKELLLNEDILSLIGHPAKVLNSLTSSLHLYRII